MPRLWMGEPTMRRQPRKLGRRSDRWPAWVGWLGLVAYITAWDLAPRTITLSSGFAPDGTHGRIGAIIVWSYITAHLTRLLPVRFDLLRAPQSPLVRIQRKMTGP